ncbi:unnamed protein product [Gongylonema pulchrum]|uniref:Serpin C1 n=1 Tax=Gongylonema pulchrum TaxID=637853 RepID=A0A183ECK3_9BILA|nr:unnamed protein product [Gongylonema pulchrum]
MAHIVLEASFASDQSRDTTLFCKCHAHINNWVEKQTRDKIENLVRTENVGDDTRLMLINAVYFNGIWKNSSVDMMAMMEQFSYYEDKDVQVLGMPYGGGQTQMLIILPQRRFGLAGVEQKLTGKQLLSYVQQTYVTEVEVELPRFKLEKRLELVRALQKLEGSVKSQ